MWPIDPSAVPESAFIPLDLFDNPIDEVQKENQTVNDSETEVWNTSHGLLADAAETVNPLPTEHVLTVSVEVHTSKRG